MKKQKLGIMNRLLLISIVLTALILALTEDSWSQQNEELSTYVITNVAVVDVEKGEVLPSQTVIVKGDRIEKIAAEKVKVSDTAIVLEGDRLYLMPGLVDAHVHYLDPKIFGLLMVAHGVVLVRDMGNTTPQAILTREKLKKGELLGPEMVTTGRILDGVPPFVPPVSSGIPTPEKGREAVNKLAGAGVNQIKVYSGLERDVFLAIVDEAKRKGLKTVGHVPETVYIEEAASVGQKSCEHMFGFGKVIAKLLGEPVKLERGGMGTDVEYFFRQDEVDQKKLQNALIRIRDNGMAVCPTLVVFKHGAHLSEIFAGEYPMLEYVSPRVRNIWKMWEGAQQDPEKLGKIRGFMQEFLKKLNKMGFSLLVGTDLLFPGLIAGYSLHEEMEMWQEAGIPQEVILRSATLTPAEFVGLDKRLGSVKEGKTASLVLVRANPLENIRNAEKIESLFLRGKYFSREDLDCLLKEVKKLCGKKGRDFL
ncbi:MAG: amidohydrolase family protein [Candidatus Aminicenantes bacterium]|jgi:imidazolonepropionase-like amidohydrolase